jgi:hypothetical protein
MNSLFKNLLGESFHRLPQTVRRIHGLEASLATEGLAEVVVAPGFWPWLICKLAGLPKTGHNVPVTVSFHPDGLGGERWQRSFANRHYASTISIEETDGRRKLIERLGLFAIEFSLAANNDHLAWSLKNWWFVGIPLPKCTKPQIECRESEENARFVFDIAVVFPLVGPVIHYQGWLVPRTML